MFACLFNLNPHDDDHFSLTTMSGKCFETGLGYVAIQTVHI